MTDRGPRDPLVHGPRSKLENAPSSYSTSNSGDSPTAPLLEKLSPVDDLRWLFTQPNAFFSYFTDRDTVPSWVRWKSFLFYFLVNVISAVLLWTSFKGMQWNIQTSVHGLPGAEFSLPWGWSESDLVSWLDASQRIVLQSLVLVFPLIVLLVDITYVWGLQLLMSWSGFPENQLSFSKLCTLRFYSQWPGILVLIPVLGPTLAALGSFVAMMASIKISYRCSWIKAFMLCYGWLWFACFVMFVGVFAITLALLTRTL